jgi:hypothetical protein
MIVVVVDDDAIPFRTNSPIAGGMVAHQHPI